MNPRRGAQLLFRDFRDWSLQQRRATAFENALGLVPGALPRFGVVREELLDNVGEGLVVVRLLRIRVCLRCAARVNALRRLLAILARKVTRLCQLHLADAPEFAVVARTVQVECAPEGLSAACRHQHRQTELPSITAVPVQRLPDLGRFQFAQTEFGEGSFLPWRALPWRSASRFVHLCCRHWCPRIYARICNVECH